MILFINTSDYDGLSFALIRPTGQIMSQINESLAYNENYKSLELLEKFLLQKKVSLKDLTKIIVCTGPGSFTGIRVGISIAQGLSFALAIPLLGITKNNLPQDLSQLANTKKGKTIKIEYGANPNITKQKKRRAAN